MQRKQRIIIFLALCGCLIFAANFISLRGSTSGVSTIDDSGMVDIPSEEYTPKVLKNIFDNIKLKSGNICLVSLPSTQIAEWMEFNKNNSFKLYAIHQRDSKALALNENINMTPGSLTVALANFTFQQKLVECDIVHFGTLNKLSGEWEAAWLASRMFVAPTNMAVWSKTHAGFRDNAFVNTQCIDKKFCLGELKPVNTNFANRSDLILQLEYAKYIPKRGKSINFFAYNPNKHTMEEGVRAAVEAARLYRKHNPKGSGILLTLFTNDRDFDNKEQLFDRIIGIKHALMFNNKRQWSTRVIYTSFAPFDFSLFVDSDTWNCGELRTFFDFLEDHPYDFAINGHLPDTFHLPDCGVYAYKWNDRTRELLLEWFNQFVEDYQGDDQARLLRAMRVMKGKVSIGLLSSTHACRFSPGEHEDWGGMRSHQQTMILTGPVRIIHAREANAKICDALNVDTDRKRVFVCKSKFNFQHDLSDVQKQDKLADCLKPVFNQKDCDAGLDNLCHNNNWDANPKMIEPNRDFMEIEDDK